jgi:hypothetical protein
MFFGIVKVAMDSETTNEYSFSHAASICERVSSKFKVLAKSYQQGSYDSTLVVAIALLDRSEEKLNQKIDTILAFLESSGLGRILEHKTLCDQMDSLDSDENEY